MANKYAYKIGYRGNVNAQIVGERIERLSRANKGHVTPSIVVDDARPGDSPLHSHFNWDDTAAAEQWRLEQARSLLRSIRVVAVTSTGEEKRVLSYVHVELPKEGPAYVSTRRAVSEPELQEQMIANALSALEALRNRYAHISALAGLFVAIDAEVAKIAKKTKQQPKPRRRAEGA